VHDRIIERNLVRRINRKLKPKGQALKKVLKRNIDELGEYIVVDLPTNGLVATDIDLWEEAKELCIQVSPIDKQRWAEARAKCETMTGTN
jgi:hypothetical protein